MFQETLEKCPKNPHDDKILSHHQFLILQVTDERYAYLYLSN